MVREQPSSFLPARFHRRLAQASFCVALLFGLCPTLWGQAMQFRTVAPCRLVDTRQSGGAIQGGSSRAFNLAQLGQAAGCDDLSTATAYSLNVTVVPQGYLGYLTIWPAGQSRPTISLMNSFDGRNKANATIVGAGGDNSISVYVTNTANVVLDINGYFEPATIDALQYYPLATPCRVADTRTGHRLQAGVERDFDVLGSSCIASGAAPAAYTLNMTAVPNPDEHPLAYLTVWPMGLPRPTVSTLNNPTGTIVANAAVVPANGTDGEVAVYPSDTTDLVIDINGYFAAPTTQGSAFYLLGPCRTLDTRNTGGAFTGQIRTNVAGGPCGLPSSAKSYVINATALPQSSLSYLTLWPDGMGRPLASTLNAIDGAYTSNMAIVGTTNGYIDAYAGGTTNLLLDLSGYMAPVAALSIATTTWPGAVTAEPYSAQLAARGGEPPYSWTVSSGSLPPGLSIAGSGLISGTPTQTGTFPFTVQVADQFSHTANQNLGIMVTQSLVVTTTQLPNGAVTFPYNATLQVNNGTPPYTWTLVSGSLPAGLGLSTAGIISGTPTTTGTSNFTVQVSDAHGMQGQAALQIIVTTLNGILNGTYALAFNGYNNGTPFLMAGSFLTDGSGHVVSGKLDYNDGSGEPRDTTQCRGNTNCPIAQTIQSTSTYDLSTGNGLGTLTLSTVDYFGNPHTYHFDIAVSAGACTPDPTKNACGRLIQTDSHVYGSGVLKVQDPSYFAVRSFFPGNFSLLANGYDPSGNRYAAVGALATNPGTRVDIDCNGNGWGLEYCPLDVNDNGNGGSGALRADPYKGSFSSDIDPATGRGDFLNITFQHDPQGLCSGTVQSPSCGFAYYIVNYQEMIAIAGDAQSKPANLTLWTLERQNSSGWSVSSVSAASILELTARHSSKADVTVGVLSTDQTGSGSLTSDENNGGTLTQQAGALGTIALGTSGNNTGKVVLRGFPQFGGGGGAVMYLYNGSLGTSGFVVGTDAKVSSGIMEPQSGPAFSNASIAGRYSGGTAWPVLTAVTNSVISLLADGAGDASGTQYTSGPGGVGGPSSLTWTYQTDSTGRAVVRDQNNMQVGVLYVIGLNKLAMVPTGSTPAVNVFSSAQPD
jgi:hypothetical protein